MYFDHCKKQEANTNLCKLLISKLKLDYVKKIFPQKTARKHE
jgi:hypothetical protein